MDFNDDEIVGLLNRLLEKLHQADGNSQGSIVLNVYSSGSLHVDHVDTQNFYGDACPKPQKEKGQEDTPTLPPSLCTEQAMVMWEKARQTGYVDDNYQPLISRTQAALLAFEMARCLGIKDKWKVFETLWNRKNMYRDYYQALDQRKTLFFRDEIKKVLA